MTEVYSIANASHFNETVPNTDQLETEITASSIATALSSTERVGDAINITFVSQISGADITTLTGLVAAHVPAVIIGNTIRNMDALVAADGSGDYLLPSAAFAAGARTICIKAGTYNETSDIIIPNNGVLHGETANQVIISFTGAYSIKIDGNDGTQETTGTISITTATTTVTGVGTTFTNLSTGNFICLDKNLYKISSIATTTSLTLDKTYRGRTLSAVNYTAQAMYSGILLRNLYILGSSGPGLYIRGMKDSTIQSCTFCTNNVGIEVINSSSTAFIAVNIQNETSHGLTFSNCQSISLIGGTSYNNGGDGYKIIGNDTDIVFNGVLSSNNTGHGINIISTASEIIINDTTLRNNNSKGLYSASTTSTILIDGSMILCNNSDGINLLGADNNISSTLVKMNFASGIVLPSGADDSIISSCICIGNTSNGISVASDNCIISSNRCKSNGGAGCIIVTGGTTNTVKTNRFTGNTGADFTNNGTSTIV